MMDLGRYEFSEGSSNKFWTIEKNSAGEYVATWGRIGTTGQGSKVYTQAEVYDKICEKVSKGYRLAPSKGVRLREIECSDDFLELLRKV
jgi:predicted DNA-binding WGR domain protein